MRANNRPVESRQAHIFSCDCGKTHKTKRTHLRCECGRQWRRRESSGIRYDLVRRVQPVAKGEPCEVCDGKGEVLATSRKYPIKVECRECFGVGTVYGGGVR